MSSIHSSSQNYSSQPIQPVALVLVFLSAPLDLTRNNDKSTSLRTCCRTKVSPRRCFGHAPLVSSKSNINADLCGRAGWRPFGTVSGGALTLTPSSAALILTGYRRIFARLQICVTVTELMHHIWHLRRKRSDEGCVHHRSDCRFYLIQTKHFFSFVCVCV